MGKILCQTGLRSELDIDLQLSGLETDKARSGEPVAMMPNETLAETGFVLSILYGIYK